MLQGLLPTPPHCTMGRRPDQLCLSHWVFKLVLPARFRTDVGKCLSRAWQPQTPAAF